MKFFFLLKSFFVIEFSQESLRYETDAKEVFELFNLVLY